MISEKERKNCTTIFLLPGIGHTRPMLLKYGFLAAYLDDINHSVHYENAVYVLFKPEKPVEFQKFLENEHAKNKLVLEDYDYEGGFTVIVYLFEEKFLPEYNLFLQGKYSEFRPEYTRLFPKSVKIRDKELKIDMMKSSLQHLIFTRSKLIKTYWEKKIDQKMPDDMELWSSPDMSKEVLDITLFQN
jgi:hypothetical protein